MAISACSSGAPSTIGANSAHTIETAALGCVNDDPNLRTQSRHTLPSNEGRDSGCNQINPEPQDDNSESPEQGRLIVQGRDAGQLDALIEGVVTIEDGCTIITSEGRTSGLIWPYGTTWDSERGTVRTADGTEISSGTMMRSGGGGQSEDDLSYYSDDVLGPDRLTPDRLACAWDWVILGNNIEIVGS